MAKQSVMLRVARKTHALVTKVQLLFDRQYAEGRRTGVPDGRVTQDYTVAELVRYYLRRLKRDRAGSRRHSRKDQET